MLLTLGLTPALQRIMVFDHYHSAKVNRAKQTLDCPAGKSINAARAARIFAPNLPITAASVHGGPTGHACRSALASLQITPLMPEGPHPTRICVTLLDRHDHTTTELVEESPPIPEDLLSSLLSTLSSLSPSLLLCAGTLAPNTPPTFYRTALELFPHIPALIDAHGPALLHALSAQTHAFRIAKLNAEEAMSTTKTSTLPDAITALLQSGASHTVITDGPHALHYSAPTSSHTLTPPKVTPLNTTGCGDCLAGTLAAALLTGHNFPYAIAQATAASAASAETLLPSQYDPIRQQQLLRELEPQMNTDKHR